MQLAAAGARQFEKTAKTRLRVDHLRRGALRACAEQTADRCCAQLRSREPCARRCVRLCVR
eukprot:6185476-Pleurochrysis_carterae.AAC.1